MNSPQVTRKSKHYLAKLVSERVGFIYSIIEWYRVGDSGKRGKPLAPDPYDPHGHKRKTFVDSMFAFRDQYISVLSPPVFESKPEKFKNAINATDPPIAYYYGEKKESEQGGGLKARDEMVNLFFNMKHPMLHDVNSDESLTESEYDEMGLKIKQIDRKAALCIERNCPKIPDVFRRELEAFGDVQPATLEPEGQKEIENKSTPMSENSSTDQNSLKASVDDKIEKLSKSKNRGDKLIAQIEKLRNSELINDNLYGEINSGAESFVQDTHNEIAKIYKSEIYVKAFRLNERFSYKPYQNVEDFRKRSIQEHQKTMSGKELDSQWSAHRNGTIKEFQKILEYKVEYLSERIQYLKKYGSDLRFILLEKYIIEPIQALSTIADQSSLLGIDMRGNGASYLIFSIAGISREHTKYPVFDVNPHFIGEGGEYYIALFDLLIELKNEFEDRFHEVFKFRPVKVNQDWIGGPPEYSNLNLESCCGELSNYISEFIKSVLVLPRMVKKHLDELQGEKGDLVKPREERADVLEDEENIEFKPFPLCDRKIEDLEWAFISEESISLYLPGMDELETRTYREAGFNNRRDKKEIKPRKEWTILLNIARKTGRPNGPNAPFKLTYREQRRNLNKYLQKFLETEIKPIVPDSDENSKILFQCRCARNHYASKT